MAPPTPKNAPPLWKVVLPMVGLAIAYVGFMTLKRETIQRDPVMDAIHEVQGLPRVLLLGDSVSISYTVPTRTRLAGVANVQRAPVNCGSSAFGVANLETWLNNEKWDCIHFNFGMHDIKHVDAEGKNAAVDQGQRLVSPDQYEANLRAIVARLKKTQAELIFATTTPVPKSAQWRVPEDVVLYNDIATKVMKSEGVQIDDLYAAIEPRFKEFHEPKKFQMNGSGASFLAGYVTTAIRIALDARKAEEQAELDQDLE